MSHRITKQKNIGVLRGLSVPKSSLSHFIDEGTETKGSLIMQGFGG